MIAEMLVADVYFGGDMELQDTRRTVFNFVRNLWQMTVSDGYTFEQELEFRRWQSQTPYNQRAGEPFHGLSELLHANDRTLEVFDEFPGLDYFDVATGAPTRLFFFDLDDDSVACVRRDRDLYFIERLDPMEEEPMVVTSICAETDPQLTGVTVDVCVFELDERATLTFTNERSAGLFFEWVNRKT
jgi:hypothetical protein